jgi:hypothetical protein
MLELYKEMGRPTVEVVQELLMEYSVSASAGIIGISPHTLKKYAVERGIEFAKNRQPVERKPYKAKRECVQSRILELGGRRESLAVWARELGVGHALTKPPCPRRFQKGNIGGFAHG